MSQEPNSQTNSTPTPAPAAPILGVDPPAAPVAPPAPPVVPSGNPPAAPQAQQKTLSMEEWNALQEKASRYDYIANDTELATKLVDHVKSKTGQISTRPTNNQPAQQQGATPSVDPTINQLREENRLLAQRQARTEIELFKAKHSDFDQVKDEMARVVNKYPGISIDDAYSLAKSAKQQSSPAPVRENPATPTTETNRSAGQIAGNQSLEDIKRRINDQKATPRFDDAIDLAFQAAKMTAEQ